MERLQRIYAFSISILSIFACLGLANFADQMIDFWRYKELELTNLPSWTLNAPVIIRASMIFPAALLILAVMSLRKIQQSQQWLMHGMGITALVLALITLFAVTAAFLPSLVTFTTLSR